MAESSISFNHSELKPSLALFLAFLSDFDNELAIDLRTFKPLSVLKNILAAATVAAPAKKEKKDLLEALMTLYLKVKLIEKRLNLILSLNK